MRRPFRGGSCLTCTLTFIIFLNFYLLMKSNTREEWSGGSLGAELEEFDFGKIWMVIVVESLDKLSKYRTALATLECYSRMNNYTLRLLSTKEFPRCRHIDFMFRRHCVIAEILNQTEYVMFLDADMAVVNPQRKIEEFIDHSVDITFYERFFNWELAAGSYIVKNTDWAKGFLQRFADYETRLPHSFHGTDNGAIHIFLADELFPELKDDLDTCRNAYSSSRGYASLFRYEACVRSVTGYQRTFDKVKIMKKGTGWVRDIWLSDSRWNPERDFMLHALQDNRRTKFKGEFIDRASSKGLKHLQFYSPFVTIPDINKCSDPTYEWDMDERLIWSSDKHGQWFAYLEKRVERERWISMRSMERYVALLENPIDQLT